MNVTGIRILPPLAVGRLGSADEPLASYVVGDDPGAPLGFRPVSTAETLLVDVASGEIVGSHPPAPQPPPFKKDGRIRPVAPFLEVFAVTGAGSDEAVVPLDLELLARLGLSVRWRAEVGNYKIFRRTGQLDDQIRADTGFFADHQRHALQGYCANFLPEPHGGGALRRLPLGWVQFIKPTPAFPQIRLRFTPAGGQIYGSTPPAEPVRVPPPDMPPPAGETPWSSEIDIPADRILYDSGRGSWNGYRDSDPVTSTLGPGLYASYGPTPYFNYYDEPQPSRGYFDDTCDGIITVELVDAEGAPQFSAQARICAAPPLFAPDSGFIRTIADDLEQVLEGPAVPAAEVTPEQAEDIVRRAYETVRFMHVPLLNGDYLKDGPADTDTMPGNDVDDLERLEAPVMGDKPTTQGAVALHAGIFSGLSGGDYSSVLRQPDQIGDLSDDGRGKMPALMSGADARYLALTRRQISIMSNIPAKTEGKTAAAPALTPRNLTAQLNYRPLGNPASATAASAIGNCCPGLELDFRSVWRRVFEGITLVEHTNYVVQTTPPYQHLLGRRLLKIDGQPVVVQAYGPTKESPDKNVLLATKDNPQAVLSLEWSNALAAVLQKQGQTVTCLFSAQATEEQLPADAESIAAELTVRRFFAPDTAVIARDMAAPGELTQGLCSPWQNDFRECVCYYWASSRPDFVNADLQSTANQQTSGDNWLQKERNGRYVIDSYLGTQLINYQDLFRDWEGLLRFQIGGKDAD